MPKYKIVWDPKAELQLVDIWLYIAHESVKYANELSNDIKRSTERLITNPFLGQEEGLLKNKKVSYRYLVYSHYKIIYRIFEDKIFITTIFDTRQRPSKLKKVVKKT